MSLFVVARFRELVEIASVTCGYHFYDRIIRIITVAFT